MTSIVSSRIILFNGNTAGAFCLCSSATKRKGLSVLDGTVITKKTHLGEHGLDGASDGLRREV
eukprot:CAMPEP_0184359814 /NCGR_PEP_ID=MMETSP1089-20130417/121935_1 /TAXON_ID=38269 ORGANISM="Gloeochaete wittrockiana, Strain SAG46.84" /NCGR_SAMPLE_ID=MMETSP1089 /ASSEMBLY_ACC=CAM_ASM_000445 /LENGTH=62 /DNA_ID=CAMNT_0026698781 /DNA_START=144 /DNA_END=332 /DNA_ORIENTATION=-